MASTDDPILSDSMESFDKVSKADELERPAHQPTLGSLDLDDPAVDITALAIDMQRRCQALIDEMDQLHAYLKEQKKEIWQVEIRPLKSACEAELKKLGKQIISDPDSPKTKSVLRTSNLPHLTALWSTAKTCTELTALQKKLYSDSDGHAPAVAMIDIVAQGGLEWVKVSLITEKRILWDLTKAGWGADGSSEESDEDDLEPEGLLKQVEALVKASQGATSRIRYQHPKIRFVLPRLKAQPEAKEVADVLRQIRNLGVTVQTAEDIPPQIPPLADVLHRVVYATRAFSETLNVDCTILLSFISDISHGRVDTEDWHNRLVASSIEAEKETPLLPSVIWPGCAGRKLVCTREAAARMLEIVETIGTETEKKRAPLLLDMGNDSLLTREQRRQELQKLSDYAIPQSWHIPIKIVDVDMTFIMSKLPKVAENVSGILTPINRAVFLFGWFANMTILSSNEAAMKKIAAVIEREYASAKALDTKVKSEDYRGPDIWLTLPYRSLATKEKRRKEKKVKGIDKLS